MNHWDARAQTIIANAREQERVPPQARARIRSALLASVAVSTLTGTVAQAKAAPWALAKLPAAAQAASAVLPSTLAVSSPFAVLAPLTIGVALGLSAIAPSQSTTPRPVVDSPRPSEPVELPQASSRLPRQHGPAPLEPALAIAPPVSRRVAPALPTVQMPVSSESVAPTPADDVSAEAELLGRARLMLRQGDAALSLQLLDRYEQSYPHGVLHLECLAMRATANCHAGRTGVGLRLLSELEAIAPQSGFLDSIRAACGAGSKAGTP
jgi:hypothetical protein